MKEFGTILKELRESKGLTQEGLGNIIHVSRSAIAKYENGLGLPSEEVVLLILDYFKVEREYLFPKEDVEQLIISKNKKLRSQKLLLIFSLCISILILFIGVMNIISKSASSGRLNVISASKVSDSPSEQIRFFTYEEYEFGYKNIYKNSNNEFVLLPKGELWSVDGLPDYLMGYYNGENTSLYMYTNALNKVEIKCVSITSSDKYCYDTSKYKFGYNFVIINNSLEEINIKQLEFWC